jgi:hypothetical protein
MKQIDRRHMLAAGAAGVGLMMMRGGEKHDAVLRLDGVQSGVVLDLPPEYRTKNWGGGSCVHASTVTLLRWMGQDELADWWRKNYSGGEYDDRLIKRMEAAGLRYAYIHGRNSGMDAGVQFLEYCTRTRRGAGIFYKPAHAINYVGSDAERVYLLDNNATGYPEKNGTYENVERGAFYRNWDSYGAFAWTLIYNPPPHRPL